MKRCSIGACSIIDGRSIVVNTTPADCIAMGDSCKVTKVSHPNK